MNKLKLHKCFCYTTMVGGYDGPFLKKYKGYCFYMDGIKFDVFRSEMFGWQLNWEGSMVEHNFKRLKDLKEFVLKNKKFSKDLEFIKKGKGCKYALYDILLKKEIERENKDENKSITRRKK